MSQLMRLNGITPPYTIRVDERLRLPAPVETALASAGPTPLPPPGGPVQPGVRVPAEVEIEPLSPASGPAQAPLPSPTTAPAPPQPAPPAARPPGTVAGQPGIKPPPPVSAAIPQPAPRLGKTFLWPVTGKVVSGFGPKQGGLHNDGINILAPRGTPIRAAENGVVAYAGNELRGFGNLLLIKHADGWTSAYAHTDTILVRRGDRVARGQVIAKVGSTGNVSSPQLHFELREGARAVDPLRHLGTQKAAL
jgi:murein DD-endopeptidase MepM/ murein hydrolase activator NlpD